MDRRSQPEPSRDDQPPAASFDELYRVWYPHVARWTRALGAPPAEREDVTQEVFVVARRGFSRFDGRNTAGWLYLIARRKVRDLRRSAWFRRLIGRPESIPEPPSEAGTPLGALERSERRRVLDQILARMTEQRRTVFVLFEIEGYSGEEIAALERIPTNTVWTRLHRARKEFFALADACRRASEELPSR